MVSGLMTVVLFASFIGIFVWAWSDSRRERFADAARLPLIEDEQSGDKQS